MVIPIIEGDEKCLLMLASYHIIYPLLSWTDRLRMVKNISLILTGFIYLYRRLLIGWCICSLNHGMIAPISRLKSLTWKEKQPNKNNWYFRMNVCTYSLCTHCTRWLAYHIRTKSCTNYLFSFTQKVEYGKNKQLTKILNRKITKNRSIFDFLSFLIMINQWICESFLCRIFRKN